MSQCIVVPNIHIETNNEMYYLYSATYTTLCKIPYNLSFKLMMKN